LTLQPGGYGIGAPGSNVVTITNHPVISPAGTNITTNSGNWNGTIGSLGRRPIADDEVLVQHTVSLTNTTESLKACTVSNAGLTFRNWNTTLNAATVTVQNAGILRPAAAVTAVGADGD
jgi:hypothetical protein